MLKPGTDYVITEKLTVCEVTADVVLDGSAVAIGGFHTLCDDVGDIQDHPLRGYKAGDPLPTSLWNLNHRAKCGNNAGLVYDPTMDLWVDIYLFASQGRKILHEKLDDYQKLALQASKRLPTHEEFSSLAAGSNDLTNIKGSKYDAISGGHVDTLGRRMISNIGCEDCAGLVWQWLSSVDPADSAYTLFAGGSWSIGASSGSRSRYAGLARSYAYADIGARFVAEPLYPRTRRTSKKTKKR
jgi:hypothetical protein